MDVELGLGLALGLELESRARRGWLWALVGLGALALTLVSPLGLGHAAAQQANGNLLQAVDSRPELSTLGRAVRVAGLADTLAGPGPYTLWAPTNDGFAKLPAGTLDSLLANPPALRDILTYHLASAPITAAQIVQVPNVRTLEGEAVRIRVDGSSVHLNDATVTEADLRASNGIIHVIDSVMVPPSRVGALPTAGDADTGRPTVAVLGALLLLAGAGLRLGPGRRLVRAAARSKETVG